MKKIILTIGIICFFAVINFAQENDKNKEKKEDAVLIEIKEGADPLIYIDGKEYDKDIIKLIDKDKIQKIKIIKGDSVFSVYDTPHVIMISTSKDKNKKDVFSIKYDHDFDYIYEYEINVDSIRDIHTPRVLVNGVLVNPDSLKKISPDDIIKINVMKDKDILMKYHTKKGVIMVTTKEKKKKKEKKK